MRRLIRMHLLSSYIYISFLIYWASISFSRGRWCRHLFTWWTFYNRG